MSCASHTLHDASRSTHDQRGKENPFYSVCLSLRNSAVRHLNAIREVALDLVVLIFDSDLSPVKGKHLTESLRPR